MEDNYREFYQLMCESYLSDGIYIWEDFGVECDTLEQCFGCLDYAQTNPEFTDFKIEFRQVTVVIAPSEDAWRYIEYLNFKMQCKEED